MLGLILQTNQGTLTQGQQLGSFLKSGICPPQNSHFHLSALWLGVIQKYPKEVPLVSPSEFPPCFALRSCFLGSLGRPWPCVPARDSLTSICCSVARSLLRSLQPHLSCPGHSATFQHVSMRRGEWALGVHGST